MKSKIQLRDDESRRIKVRVALSGKINKIWKDPGIVSVEQIPNSTGYLFVYSAATLVHFLSGHFGVTKRC